MTVQLPALELQDWNSAGVDIFRLNEDGEIIEHWKVLQQILERTASGNDMLSQLS